MKNPPPRLDTVETLAARFGLPSRTIMREVMLSRLPYVSIAGQWRFRERDIEVWQERIGPLPKLSVLPGGSSEPSSRPSPGAADRFETFSNEAANLNS